MNKLSLIAIYILFTSITVLNARGGSMDGGGGDNLRPESNSAWFLSDQDRKIRFCLKVGDDFPKTESYLTNQIERAFGTWENYLYFKEIQDPNLLGDKMLLTKVEKLLECSGSEDLTFYFGVKSQEVDEATDLFDNPTAFAKRTEYDMQKGWGNGFIWFANQYEVAPRDSFPNWNQEKALFGVLLHEIGHVLGNSHVPYTIMGRGINRLLKIKDPQKLTSIDHEKELVRGNGNYKSTYMQSTKEGFEALTGINSDVDQVLSALEFQSFPLTAKLVMKIENISFEFDINIVTTITPEMSLNFQVFKRVYLNKPWVAEHYINHQYQSFQSAVYLGSIKQKNHDKNFPVILEYNMGYSMYKLSLLNSDGSTLMLFHN